MNDTTMNSTVDTMKRPLPAVLGREQLESISTLRLPALIRQMPKAELHVHIEGCLEPELAFELARRNGVPPPYVSVEMLRRAYRFDGLQSFLDLYYAVTDVLRKEEDFYDLAMAYFRTAALNNVVHAEIFFDPQAHMQRGIGIGVVIGGLSKACADARHTYGISSGLILCFLRHLSEASAFETLEQAMPYREHFIGVGLDSSEYGHPPQKFERVFRRCRELGLRRVAHAGEEGPASYIREALDLLHVERVDHGVQCLGDQRLIERLVRERIPLTVCPLSNVLLRVFPSMADHNLDRLLSAGIVVTVNSDDPAYFGGYINRNYIEAFEANDALNAYHAYLLAANSIEASFADADDKQGWMEQLNTVFNRQTP